MQSQIVPSPLVNPLWSRVEYLLSEGRRECAKSPTQGSVLITEGGDGRSRAAVCAVRILSSSGYRPVVTVSSKRSLAAASRYCRGTVAVPKASSPGEYAEAVLHELQRHPYCALLPSSDDALTALEAPVMHVIDKSQCSELASAAGFLVPRARSFHSAHELLDQAATFAYPVVVKPARKGMNAEKMHSAQQVRAAARRLAEVSCPILVQEFIEDPMGGMVGLMWNGKLLQGVKLRYEQVYPFPCGTMATAVTCDPDPVLDKKFERLLQGYNGIFHADLAGDHLLDLNPRIHAGLAVAYAAGIDPVTGYCELLRGQTVEFRRGVAGIRFRWLEGEIKSSWAALRSGQMELSSAVRKAFTRGSIFSYESFTDVGPVFERFRYGIAKLRDYKWI
jgi:hypothetical protein